MVQKIRQVIVVSFIHSSDAYHSCLVNYGYTSPLSYPSVVAQIRDNQQMKQQAAAAFNAMRDQYVAANTPQKLASN